MLELAILGLLKEQPMHGYQLSRELGDALGGFWRVSYGSLYPTLRRLERDGAIEVVQGDQPTAGRRKHVYRITEHGESVFLELLQETPHDNSTEDTRFRVRLAFFRYLPPETRIRLLERRRATLEDRLTTISDSLRTTRARVDDYTLVADGARPLGHRVRPRVGRRPARGGAFPHDRPPASERRSLRRKEHTS